MPLTATVPAIWWWPASTFGYETITNTLGKTSWSWSEEAQVEQARETVEKTTGTQAQLLRQPSNVVWVAHLAHAMKPYDQ